MNIFWIVKSSEDETLNYHVLAARLPDNFIPKVVYLNACFYSN